MVRRIPKSSIAAFALVEALVALLLLAVAVLGAVGTVVESLAGQRGMLLRSQAADLAADLAEALRSAPDPQTVQGEIRSWQNTVRRRLPQAEAWVMPATSTATFSIRIHWQDARAPAPETLSLLLRTDQPLVVP